MSIKVSELEVLSQITSDDYIVLNDSGSTTTNRATFSTLSSWLTGSGITTSASLVSTSASFAQTSSYASSARSASYGLSASYALNSTTASYASSSTAALSASYALSSSYALSALSASYGGESVLYVVSSSYGLSSSYAASASYGLSASYALNSTTASYASSSTATVSASYSVSSSYALSALSASYGGTSSYEKSASYVLSASYSVSSSYALSASYVENLNNILNSSTINLTSIFTTDVTFKKLGVTYWSLPPFVDQSKTSTDAVIILVGAGGSGGGSNPSTNPPKGGGGGGGGMLIVKNIKLLPSTVYTIHVGWGGAAKSTNNSGEAGKSSSFAGIIDVNGSNVLFTATSSGGSGGKTYTEGVGGGVGGTTSVFPSTISNNNFSTPAGQSGSSAAYGRGGYYGVATGSHAGNFRTPILGVPFIDRIPGESPGEGGYGGQSLFLNGNSGAGNSGSVFIRYILY